MFGKIFSISYGLSYLEGLSAVACSKGSPNVMLFEVITYVFDSYSALLFLIVG